MILDNPTGIIKRIGECELLKRRFEYEKKNQRQIMENIIILKKMQIIINCNKASEESSGTNRAKNASNDAKLEHLLVFQNLRSDGKRDWEII